MKERSRFKTTVILGTVLLIIVCLTSACIGSYPLSLSEILRIMNGRCQDTMAIRVFYTLRLPRVGMGVLTGIALGISGAVFQLMFQNPLASPDLVGVASGASLGTAIAIVLGAGTVTERMTGSFLGGIGALIFVLALVGVSGKRNSGTYILAGIIVSAVCNAMIMLLKYMADSDGELASIDFWTMGSLASVTLHKLRLAVWPVLVSISMLLTLRKELLLLSLGQEEAACLGLRSNQVRIILLVLATLATASVITVTGVISFVGLLAPHITYLITRRKTLVFLIGSGITGGVLVTVADCFARSIAGQEVPTSVLTTFCALPLLIYLMCRKNGGEV